MKIPKALLKTKQRKEMWRDASRIVIRLDKKLGFSEIYAIGSFVSKKKRPSDIDFALVTKIKKDNSAWPIDLVIVPEGDNTEEYLKDICKWMKRKYKRKCKAIKLK